MLLLNVGCTIQTSVPNRVLLERQIQNVNVSVTQNHWPDLAYIWENPWCLTYLSILVCKQDDTSKLLLILVVSLYIQTARCRLVYLSVETSIWMTILVATLQDHEVPLRVWVKIQLYYSICKQCTTCGDHIAGNLSTKLSSYPLAKIPGCGGSDNKYTVYKF